MGMAATGSGFERPKATGRAFVVEAVLFDFDGTLTKQGAIDFEGMRQAVGVPDDMFILEYIRTLDMEAQAKAEATVAEMEKGAAARSEPNDGAEEAVRAATDAGLPVGIVTRNTRVSLARSLENFPGLRLDDFDVVVTREDGHAVKPAPDAIVYAAEVLGVPVECTMMVGDFRLDVEAGHAAGAITVYLHDAANDGEHPEDGCDVVISSLQELPAIIALGLEAQVL